MSVPTPGNFDCSNIPEVKAEANEIWTDDVRKRDYMAESDTAQMVLGMQTARLNVLETPEKDYDLKLYWIADCDDEDPVPCDPGCEIEGPTIGDMCQNLALTECIQKSFSVTENQFRTSLLTKDKVVAPMLLKKGLLMDRDVSKFAIQFLDDNAGVNQYTSEYTVAGNLTTIPAAAWNPDLWGYFAKARAINKLPQMRVLDSGRLFRSFWKVDMESTNPTGAAEQRKINSFGNVTFDLHQIEPVLSASATFLINPNSVAIAGKTRFTPYGSAGRNLVAGGFDTNWSTYPSPTLPGVVYDLVRQIKCIPGRDIEEVWQLEWRYGMFLNPLGCLNDVTGIIELRCAA